MIEVIEQAILDKLAPLRDLGIWVRGLPDRPSEYGQTFENGQLALVFDRSNFGDAAIGGIQEEVINFRVDMRLAQLRSNSGGYAIGRAVISILTNFTPPQCSEAIRAKVLAFEGQLDNLWVYSATFTTKTMLVPISDLDSNLPRLAQIIAESNFGEIVLDAGGTR